MRVTTFALLLASLTVPVLAACGGGSGATPPPAAPTEAEASAPKEAAPADGSDATPTPAHADSGFDALSHEQKVEVMSTKVVPNVGKLFKAHDAAKFGKFGCATCHGPEKKAEPHDVLPKLTLSNGGFEKLAKAKPAMMKFMGEEVVPAMAAALGEKPYDPETKQGFGCGGCHKVD